MKIYFAWCAQGEVFSPHTHARHDLQILSIDISQREGELAIANVVIPVTDEVKPSGWAYVCVEDDNRIKPLFFGVLSDARRQHDDQTKSLEFLARPKDVSQQLSAYLSEAKESEVWHPLFVDQENQENPTEALEAQPMLFHWDRVTHKLSLSHFFEADRSIDITNHVLHDNFSYKITELPFAKIDVELRAEWVQIASGDFDLFPVITKAFEGGYINTLTAKPLISSWPRSGWQFGRSGYVVTQSYLKEFSPNKTGILNIYRTLLTTSQSGDYASYQRRWLKGKLCIAWHYRQKRRDIVKFSLHHRNQLKTYNPKSKKLVLSLQSLDAYMLSSSSAKFIPTPAGVKAINHAIKIASCHLAASSRCLEIEVQVPLQSVIDLTLDTLISISHPALPIASMTAKLISYRFHISHGKNIAWLRLASALGEDGKSNMVITGEEVIPLSGSDQGLDRPDLLHAEDFIEHLTVSGGVREQLDCLQEGNDCIPVTAIDLRLKDLRTSDVIETHYCISTPLFWSAARQINLQEVNNAIATNTASTSSEKLS